MIDPNYRMPLVFDIETAPILNASEYIDPPPPPANYKDPEKIEAYVAEKHADLIARAALDPDLARVVAVGMQVDGMAGPLVMIAKDEAGERDVLEQFWRRVGDGPDQAILIGFAILQYDLRVLLRRSLYLNVKAARVLIDKFRHPGVVDLMDILSFSGAEKFHSLNFYVKRFGLGPFDADITGSAIGLAVATGQWDVIEAHCKIDVAKTVALAKRMGVLAA